MDNNVLEKSKAVWVNWEGGQVLAEKLFLEREKDVLQIQLRRGLK